jgi:hypothetical protein
VLGSDPPQVAVVGGTSTTQERTELDAGCDPDSCKEFPARDDSIVRVTVGRVTTTEAAFATAEGSVVVPASGANLTVRAPAPAGPHADGEITALLQGFSLQTDHPLSGGVACYQPANGWHPRRLGIAVDDARREGSELVADLSLHFVAGNTDDPDRVCVDEVNEQSMVPMTVQLLFVAGPAASTFAVEQAVAYPWNGDQFAPEEQPPPDPLVHDLPEGIRGWSSVDFHFNEDKPGERGAYLRTLDFHIDGGEVTGTATNYSPITQLHDFSYRFSGTAVGIPISGTSRTTYDAVLPTGLDDDGEPVVYSLDGSTPTE